MSQNDPQLDGLFPRDLFGRLALGLVSLLLAPASGLILFSLVFGPGVKPLAWHDRIALLLLEEFLLGLFLFFSVGLLWAIAAPRWLERWKRPTVLKLAFGFLAVVLASVITLSFV